jgi:sulfite dehydrogenase
MRTPRLLVILALAFAGCGGGEDDTADRSDQAASGEPKQVFASTCGGCHTLADAGTTGQIGPVLDELEPNAARVVRAIEKGPGQMPEGLLAGKDAQAVADYVAGAAGK